MFSHNQLIIFPLLSRHRGDSANEHVSAAFVAIKACLRPP